MVSHMRLTDISVRAIKPPEKGSVTHFDDALKGFGVRVSSGGTKSFVLVHGKARTRVPIGTVGVIGLKEARDKARDILAEKQLGRYQAPTVRFTEALDHYIAQHVENLKPSTKTEIKRLLNTHFRPKFQHQRLDAVTRQSVAAILRNLMATPSTALHAYAAIATFFRWATGPYLETNPLASLKPPSKAVTRDRVLTATELGKLFATSLLGGNYATLVALLILTAQRLNQIASLRGEWIDRDNRMIVFPAEVMKRNREHRIVYGDLAADILDQLPTTGLLLPARGREDTPMSGFSKLKPAFDRKAGLPKNSYRLHDLRRTAASNFQALKVPIAVTEKLLGHSETTGGIVAVYQRYDYVPEMRDAVALWEQHLSSLLATR